MDIHGAWFKSSYSNGEHDTDCVEVAGAPDVVHVRDSKDVRRPSFSVPRTTWAAFVRFASER
ncbi:DUF397 domain-containing protein [Streptomyces chumphonensis]|uniref:DUF397 domain-containing protein n=1 Tax=Streptomyces chumphonensis TaxID=1214925 RepID=A0A927EYT1_9ACTN|nr:DUF397 domain-containing protein [Streptomyces chumphonensis]MBD3932484.1 DUF397 domain-containing protein [Streptomyces chumphonensis]